MALSLTSIARVSGANCNHFNTAYALDGVNRGPVIDKTQVENFLENLDTGLPAGATYKDVMMILMIRYYLAKGYTLAQLPAKCQLPD